VDNYYNYSQIYFFFSAKLKGRAVISYNVKVSICENDNGTYNAKQGKLWSAEAE